MKTIFFYGCLLLLTISSSFKSIKSDDTGVDIKAQITEFAEAYITNSSEGLSKFIDKEIDMTTANNFDGDCVHNAGIEDSDRKKIEKIGNVQKGLPDGGFCEGYPGIADGFYYEEVYYIDMRSYLDLDMGDDPNNRHHAYKPEKYINSEILKVQIIHAEKHYAMLYFLISDHKLIYWVEDFCSCSN